jgi:glycosyltransferase involved in cell wall biosynthesis
MKRILYLCKTDRTGPSSRYRIYQFLPGLEEAGIRVTPAPLFRKPYFRLVDWPPAQRIPGKAVYAAWRFLVRAVRLFTAGAYDAVVIEHQLFPYLPACAERLLRACRIPFALEFDDAIYLTPFHARKMRVLTRLARQVIVGNRFLEDYAKEQNPNVQVVPTVVDLSKYRLKEDYQLQKEGPRIGWIGLRYNLPFLTDIIDGLPDGATLQVVSSSPLPMGDKPVVFTPWAEESEAEVIKGFDVGIMPLPDSEWARGKCGLKVLQYMAAGVPVVASPVGVNSDIIRDGENGFLATTLVAWRDRLARLLDSGTLRERLGREGRKTVESGYTLNHGLKLLSTLYQSL